MDELVYWAAGYGCSALNAIGARVIAQELCVGTNRYGVGVFIWVLIISSIGGLFAKSAPKSPKDDPPPPGESQGPE